MIKKLLLVRVPKMTSTRLDEAGLIPFISNYAEPLNVCPIHEGAWPEEAGISHHGFLMEMKLKEWKDVEKFGVANPDVTLLDLIVNKKDRSVEDTLKTVGLRIHPSA